MKKVISVVLVVILMLTAAPLSGFVGIELPRLTASAAITGTYGNLSYREYNSYVVIIDYEQEAASIEIPSSINGKPVTSIGGSAFSSCSSLKSITIPDSVTSIGGEAFWGCGSLQSITIPSSVTSIGDGAFEYCNSLKEVHISSISAWCNISFGSSSANPLSNGAELYLNNNQVENLVIPDGIPEIKDYTFAGFRSLKSITIPNSVTSIGDSAFSGCWSLQSITIPDSVTSIGYSAFEFCSSLQSITIPTSVTSIGGWAFNGCSSLQSITIPDSVTSIGDWAFDGCSSLASITIPDSVTSIGDGAFAGCRSLQSITIPNAATSIGSNVFSYCESLQSITIPDSVTSIGYSAFEQCIALKTVNYLGTKDSWENIVIGFNNAALTNANIKCAVLIYKEYDSYVEIIGCDQSAISVEIPETINKKPVTSIGNKAFDGCSSLQSISIPDSVTSIGSNAFSGCSSLQSITIPDSVTSIGVSVFLECSSLVAFNVAETNENYCSVDGVLFNKDKTILIAYPAGKAAEAYAIPSSVTSIGEYAFDGCSSLQSITISDSVTYISDHAFYNCSSLQSITIPDSVTSIGEYAFNGCSSLKEVYISSMSAWCNISFGSSSANPLSNGAELYLNNNRVENLVIPDGVTAIKTYAFNGCSSLQSITIPDSVTSIGHYAFEDCSSLESITIPDSVTSIGISAFSGTAYYNNKYNWENGVLYIGKHLIAAEEDIADGCTIKNNTKTIADRAFYNFSSLQSITIPDSVNSIGWGAFEGCSSLQSITIPDSVTSIGNSAFWGCSSLQSITIPDSVTSIYEYAFSYCSSLQSIKIPDSVTSIDRCAFYYCSSLQSIKIPDSVTSIGDGAFLGTAYYNNKYNWENGVLYLGNHLIRAKENISGGYTVKHGTKTIADNAFSGCSSLKSITIPDSVTSIGEYAFWGYSSLQSITIPDSVTSIGWNAFDGTAYYNNKDNWENGVLYIGNHLIRAKENISGDYIVEDGTKTIANSAFLDCDILDSITIPDSVTSIGSRAFKGCSSLESIIIPDSVTSIGGSAFEGCRSLKSVAIPDSVTSIGKYAFSGTALKTVNYLGAKDSWENIAIDSGNEALINANITYSCPHKHSIKLNGKPATCSEKGLTDGKKCSVCGEIIEAQKEIPTLEHKESDWIIEKAATEDSVGYEIIECIYCGLELERREIPAGGKPTEKPTDPIADFLLGDVNGDGYVKANDARTALRAAAKLEELDEKALKAADIDGNGKVTAAEARKILRFAAKLDKELK